MRAWSRATFRGRPHTWVSTPEYWATRWDPTRALEEKLEAAGCSIPFPQRNVHLDQKA